MMKTAFTAYRYLRDELKYSYEEAHYLLICADAYFKDGTKDLFFELYRYEIMQDFNKAAILFKFIEYLGLQDQYRAEISKPDTSRWKEIINMIK